MSLQGLNNSVTKKINYQFENINNLPLDSKYLRNFNRHFEYVNEKDYYGLLVFNEYDGCFYIVDKTSTGALYYRNLSEKISSDIINVVEINSDDELENIYNNLKIENVFLYIKSLDALFFKRNYNEWFLLSEYLTISDTNYDKILKLSKLLFGWRVKYVKIKDIFLNEFKYYNLYTNEFENAIFITDDLNSIEQKVEGRIYQYDNFHYLCKDNNFIKLGEVVNTSSVNNKFQTIINNFYNETEITHNLDSIYLQIKIRIKIDENLDYFQEFILNNNDFMVIDENKIVLKYDYIGNIPYMEVFIDKLK